jgi:RNA-binding protein with serine-rich domain 1
MQLAREDDERILHVANLTRNVTAEHLKEIFGKWGSLTKVQLALDERVGLPKGWAYVEYERRINAGRLPHQFYLISATTPTPCFAEDAQVQMDGGQLDGNVLKVNFVLVGRAKATRSASRSLERHPSRGRSRSPDPRSGRSNWQPSRDYRDRPFDRNRDRNFNSRFARPPRDLRPRSRSPNRSRSGSRSRRRSPAGNRGRGSSPQRGDGPSHTRRSHSPPQQGPHARSPSSLPRGRARSRSRSRSR